MPRGRAMASRVRLPAGMLREVDGDEMRAGVAKRQAWPPPDSPGQPQPQPTSTYTPGDCKGAVADDIKALLLLDDGGARLGLGVSDSLVEEMLQKVAASAAPAGINSVPWDRSSSNAGAHEYLRGVMSDMNRQAAAVVDQTDADIQQIIDDPDAYIARTAGAHQALAGRVQSLVGPSAHSQQVAAGAGAVTGARETRTRKLAQGSTVMTASNVGKFDVSGLPSDSTSRQQSRSPEVSPVGPPRPDSGILDVTCPVSLRTTRTGDSGVRAHAQTDVPLAEMIEKKGQQTQEMQVQYAHARARRWATSACARTKSAPIVFTHVMSEFSHPVDMCLKPLQTCSPGFVRTPAVAGRNREGIGQAPPSNV